MYSAPGPWPALTCSGGTRPRKAPRSAPSRPGHLRPRAFAPPPATPRTAAVAPEKPRAALPRGYVVHVREGLIVVDLTAADGIKKGSLLSFRREGVALKHPVTGEHLGQLDEEIGTARAGRPPTSRGPVGSG